MNYALYRQAYGKPKFVEVKGRSVKFKGFEEFGFFYYVTKFCTYEVLESRTGMSIASSDISLKQAKERAQEALERKGLKYLQKITQKMIKKYGLSPKYKEANS